AFEESLVVFVAVEKEDEADPEQIVKNLVHEVKNVYGQVKAKNIVIYPYAHLSSSLSSPKVAIEVLKEAEAKLIEDGLEVVRVPFGWYKAFEVSCKGHPLSELSRTLSCEDKCDCGCFDGESDDCGDGAQDSEAKGLESKFYILDGDKTIELSDFDFDSYSKEKNNEDLKKLMEYEIGEGTSTGDEPPHVKIMKEKELCDYEPSADVGHLKWFPKGRLIRDLLSDYVYNLVVDNGAMPIETPIMYDLNDKAISEHAEKFGERQYKVQTKRELMLRFACCFGAFRVLSDSFLTWKNLPAKVYELSTYSFRLEKRGEVVGLKRLRGFTMPDLHTVCADLDQSLVEFENQAAMCLKTGVDFDVNYEIIFRATKDFYEQYKDWMHKVAKDIGKPMILEIIPERKHYWVSKMDFAAIDYLGRPIENPTVQIDVESGERFGINYLGEDEKEAYPIILHCSPTGSVERVICSLLEKTATDLKEGQSKEHPPMLPVWLSPSQVRIIPIADRHISFCEDLADQLATANIRADIDDRSETLGKKIRSAGKDWVPYTIVIGDKEMEGDTYSISIRDGNKKQDMTISDLIQEVNSKNNDMPFRSLPVNRLISKRINFQ
ncbi:MAG: threonine--tRNA ligase, partial [Methanobacteriaceae archaeon]